MLQEQSGKFYLIHSINYSLYFQFLLGLIEDQQNDFMCENDEETWGVTRIDEKYG